MKHVFIILALLLVGSFAWTQETVTQGIIDIKVETTLPESDMPSAPEGATVMRFGDGETKSRIFLKNGNMRMEADMGFGKNLVFFDAATKTTTTLIEAMGRKFGFYTNEEEIKKMAAGRDSARTAQRPAAFNPEVTIEYLAETKTIAGYVCNKAVIRYKNQKGEAQQQAVWFTPEFRLSEGLRLNMIVRAAAIPGIQKLKGFPMEFEIVRSNGMKIHYVVTKMDATAKVDDNMFVIPKGYDIKPQSEMMRNNTGGFQLRTSVD